jgi:hypothetical protein
MQLGGDHDSATGRNRGVVPEHANVPSPWLEDLDMTRRDGVGDFTARSRLPKSWCLSRPSIGTPSSNAPWRT